MKCEKCNAEFTLKEQAKAKGCCPSCGEKLPASAYRDDAKAWRWYQYHSPMPLSVIFAYVYLIGGGILALMMVLESVDLGLWTGMGLAGWLSVITAALIFLLPLFVLFFTPSARRWGAILRGDMLAYEAAVKSNKPTLLKCKTCNSEFTLWKLAWKKGCCPSCGEKIPVLEYSPGVPDRRWWRLFRGAPIGLKLSAIILTLLGFLTVFHFCFAGFQILMVEGRWALVQGIAFYVIFGVIILHVLRAVVRGRIPYVCIAALVTFSVYVTDAFAESLVVIVPLLIFALAFLTPAARRWRRKISDEDLAYWIAARSGAFPFWRKVALFVLKTTAMGLLIFGCMGVFALDPDSIERICDWINDRSVELVACMHPGGLPLREGTYYLPCSGWKWATWVEVRKGSVAGEYTIVRTFKVLNPVDESGVTIADEKREVDEYEVRQVAGRERLEVLKRRECVYLFKDGEAEPVREDGEADQARDSVLVMQRGDILIVNGLAYSLVRRLWTKQPAQKVEPLREGRYYSTNHDWQGCWIEVKKGYSEDEYILEETGSGRDTEPYDAKGFVVRQRPDQTRLEILKAYDCPCGPVVDGDSPIRKSEEISGGKCNWMSIIVSGDFLIINGLVYSFKERWWEVDE